MVHTSAIPHSPIIAFVVICVTGFFTISSSVGVVHPPILWNSRRRSDQASSAHARRWPRAPVSFSRASITKAVLQKRSHQPGVPYPGSEKQTETNTPPFRCILVSNTPDRKSATCSRLSKIHAYPVGVTGFEPATHCSQSNCASQAALHSEKFDHFDTTVAFCQSGYAEDDGDVFGGGSSSAFSRFRIRPGGCIVHGVCDIMDSSDGAMGGDVGYYRIR